MTLELFLAIAFWVSLFVVAYTYFGYPAVLLLWSWWRGKEKEGPKAPHTPSVTVVIAAWNEGARLAARIENCLGQLYPDDKLDVVIVSDGSTDDTVSVVARFHPARVRLVALTARHGKAEALNHGVAAARGEVVVFADARQRFSRTAVAALASFFSTPTIGAVSGELVLESDPRTEGAEGTEGVGLYWRIEKWIRQKEAAVDSVVGATGAVYAARRALVEPLPPGTILDDLVIPMRIVMKGYRVVWAPGALAFDRLAPHYRAEFRRKVRTLAGNYQAASLFPALLNPWQNRLFFQFLSHKLCRLVAPFALVLLLSSSAVLGGRFPQALLAIQVFGYCLALLGWGLARAGVRDRLSSAAFGFCFLNYAALVAAVRFLRKDPGLWTRVS